VTGAWSLFRLPEWVNPKADIMWALRKNQGRAIAKNIVQLVIANGP
jgi:hypothetical protein